MKELYSFQEIATLIDQGQSASFTRHIVAHVSVCQPNPNVETVKAIMRLSLGKYNIGVVEITYTDIAELLETFEIDDQEEIWVKLYKQGKHAMLMKFLKCHLSKSMILCDSNVVTTPTEREQ